MSKKKKLPGVADGAVAEVPGEDAETLAGSEPAPAFDTSDDEPETATDPADDEAAPEATASEEVAGIGPSLLVPAVGDRVRYSEIRDGMLLDVVGRVLNADGETLTLDLKPAPGSPARVVAASRYSQATRAGWWV